jgi:hypothetical protein
MVGATAKVLSAMLAVKVILMEAVMEEVGLIFTKHYLQVEGENE